MSQVANDVHFEILGPVRVRAGRAEVTVSRRERVLLATLLLHANDVVGVDTLVAAIWNDQPPQTARNQVQGCVSRLRSQLATAAPLFVTNPPGYGITVAPGRLDLDQFRLLVAEARAARLRGESDQAVDRYRAALALWRGPALAGIDSDLVRKEAGALDEERMRAAEERIEAELALGAGGELVPELTAMVAQEPYRERLHSALMLALYRAGRQADALAAYQRIHRALVDEIGTEPGEPLRDLHRRILNRQQALLPAGGRWEANHAPPAGPHCLPRAVDDFTGRPDGVNRLITAARAHAGSDAPLVLAIDGMAGVGKTTLAVHVAHQLADQYPDGQLFVDLHGHSERRPVDPSAALGALLRQLGVAAGRIPQTVEERVALWRSELAGRRVLIVLDNARSSEQATPLLPAGPEQWSEPVDGLRRGDVMGRTLPRMI